MGNLITDSEAADILRLTTRQVANLAKKGILPSVNLPGGEIRFDVDDLHQWVESRKQPATTERGQQ
jgi:excisionase family DNA binding protein